MELTKRNAHDEVYEFLVSSPTPEEILAFRPSQETQERIRQLLDANKSRLLTAEEELELDEFGKVEHFVRMLKIHASRKLNK